MENSKDNDRRKHMDVETAGEFGLTNYETVRNSGPAADEDGSVNGKVVAKLLGGYKLTKEG